MESAFLVVPLWTFVRFCFHIFIGGHSGGDLLPVNGGVQSFFSHSKLGPGGVGTEGAEF